MNNNKCEVILFNGSSEAKIRAVWAQAHQKFRKPLKYVQTHRQIFKFLSLCPTQKLKNSDVLFHL